MIDRVEKAPSGAFASMDPSVALSSACKQKENYYICDGSLRAHSGGDSPLGSVRTYDVTCLRS